MSRTRKSEAQSNAEAIARRDAPFTAASSTSFSVRWDYHRREPDNLRDAVRMVRRAYADEVPDKLHEGYDSIGEGGTPRMTARAEGYIFGNPQSSDRTDPAQMVSYYHAPFRATLDRLSHGSETERFIAAVVAHVAIGSQGPKEALVNEGIPAKAIALTAMPLLTAFLRQLTDLRLHLRNADLAEPA